MSDETRARIIEVATRLLVEGGPEAVSTRAVSAAAGVHAPAIYRIFGDKRELMDAVGSAGLAGYIADKQALEPSDDPVDDLRAGWRLHVGFGLSHPALYTVIFLTPRPGAPSPAEQQAEGILAGLVGRIAAAGRLALPEEQAARLVHATGRGTVLSMLSTPETDRDPDLPERALAMVLAAITTGESPAATGVGPAAITLRAGLAGRDDLTAGEKLVMTEWLDRIARG